MAHGYPDHSQGIDFGRRSDDYARHRPGPPAPFYDRLNGFVQLTGARVLDLGTGPGLLAQTLAARGAVVTGIDVSPAQIEAAAARTDACTFVVASAEATGQEPDAFDLVIAGQCWHWFDHDKALAEARRVLRPGGLLVVVQYAYLPRVSDVARETEALILRHNPAWGMADFDGLYPDLIDGLAHGFDLVEQFCYDYDQPFDHAGWRGRIRTCHGLGAGRVGPETLDAFDRELARLLAERYPDEPLLIAHRLWAVVVRRPDD